MRGSITRRGKHSWMLRFDLPAIDGKRRQHTVSIKGTRQDAQRELTKLLATVDQGHLDDPTRQTVGEYLAGWLNNVLTLSGKTLQRYKELNEHQINPHLGAIKLPKLRPEHIERWHAVLIAGGLSARTVGHAHRLLSRVLSHALTNGAISRNVATLQRPPKVEATEIEILSASELEVLMAGLEGHPSTRLPCLH
jgi:Phage integrase, N-terminal SAM-like domain